MAVPAASEIDRISALPPPVLRNLLITQTYHELAEATRAAGLPGANWCVFATWASKQAGQSIRGEDLKRAFEIRFRTAPEVHAVLKALARASASRVPEDIRSAVERTLAALDTEDIFDRVSDAIARGNRKVFEEIGREFARFLSVAGGAEEPFADFIWELKPGPPPDGQELLQTAFTSYRIARASADEKQRAERVLFANLLVGFHEQTRLQPEIEEALNAPFRHGDVMKRRILALVLPGFWMRIRHRMSRLLGKPLPADVLVDRLIDEAQLIARRVITEHLMMLHLAGGEVLRLGRDLVAAFPPHLQTITLPELKALLEKIDPTPDSLAQSGAADWADLDERMHFIGDYFRSYHARDDLFDPPFTSAQVEKMKGDQVPEGPL